MANLSGDPCWQTPQADFNCVMREIFDMDKLKRYGLILTVLTLVACGDDSATYRMGTSKQEQARPTENWVRHCRPIFDGAAT